MRTHGRTSVIERRKNGPKINVIVQEIADTGRIGLVVAVLSRFFFFVNLPVPGNLVVR